MTERGRKREWERARREMPWTAKSNVAVLQRRTKAEMRCSLVTAVQFLVGDASCFVVGALVCRCSRGEHEGRLTMED